MSFGRFTRDSGESGKVRPTTCHKTKEKWPHILLTRGIWCCCFLSILIARVTCGYEFDDMIHDWNCTALCFVSESTAYAHSSTTLLPYYYCSFVGSAGLFETTQRIRKCLGPVKLSPADARSERLEDCCPGRKMGSKTYALACVSCLHTLLMHALRTYAFSSFVPYDHSTQDDWQSTG